MKSTIIFLLTLAFSPILSFGEYTNYLDFNSDIRSFNIIPSKVYKIEGYYIERPDVTIMLDQGELYICDKGGLNSKIAVFIGSGTMEFTPQLQVEKNEIKRYLDKELINESFKSALFIIDDSTLIQIQKDYPLTEPTGQDLAKEFISANRGYLYLDENYIDLIISHYLLNDTYTPYLYAHIKSNDNNTYIYQYSPDEIDQVSFCLGDVYRAKMHKWVICSENSGNLEDRLNGIIDIYKRKSKISHGDINTELDSFLVKFTDRRNKWYSLELPLKMTDPEIKINDKKIYFYQHKLGNTAWLFAGDANYGKDTSLITFNYKTEYNGYYKSFYQQKLHDEFDKDIEIKYLSKKKFISNFEPIRKNIENDSTILQFSLINSLHGLIYNTENFFYESKSVNKNGMTLYYKYQNKLYFDENDKEITDITDFYYDLYGKPGPDKLTFHDSYFTDSEKRYFRNSFLVDSGSVICDFSALDKNKFDLRSLADDIARQWWFYTVSYQTYRDFWVNIGMSSYSGYLYLQKIKKNYDLYYGLLNIGKTKILENKINFRFKTIMSGPLTTEWRGSRITDAYYETQAEYDKAAWVFHMLRNLIIDLQTMDDSQFFQMIRQFYTKNKGHCITSAVFITFVNEYLNTDLSWFFNQWVNGYKIPNYAYGYNVTKTDDGKYKVNVRVKQTNVPKEFFMPVPIRVWVGENRAITGRITVTGEICSIDLPPMNEKPIKFDFNILQSVLCSASEENWEDLVPPAEAK